MYPTIHFTQITQRPLYTSPPEPPIASPSFAMRMHRLSGSTIAATSQQTQGTPPSQLPVAPPPAALAPDLEAASTLPQDLPLRPAPALIWMRIKIPRYISLRPTVSARPADIELGLMSQRRYVSGVSGQQESRRCSKRTVAKIIIVLAYLAVFWTLTILGIVLVSEDGAAEAPGT
jgi:hypothetical protein